MKIIKVKNYEMLSETAAYLLIKKIKEMKKITLGLATGSTPIGLYKKMIEDYKKNKTNYEDVFTFNLDEYVGKTSYHKYMDENLFQHIPVLKEYIHIPNGMVEDLEKECKEYEKKIEECGGIDLQILGIGRNGHIGFNEPGSPFNSKTRAIALDESTREANSQYFEKKEMVPTHALTMGMSTIFQAKEIILLISGEKKADKSDRSHVVL